MGLHRHRIAWSLAAAAVVVLIAGFVIWRSSADAVVARDPEPHASTAWAACNRNAGSGKPSTFRPLTDAHARSRVTHQREVRPDNARPYTVDGRRHAAANYYVPAA